MNGELGRARDVLRAERDPLLARANVVACGVGYKVTAGQASSTLSVVCSVTRKVDLTELPEKERVPPVLDGIPTDVVETGPFRALQSHTARHRPAPGGVSIGHRRITAGTLGCLVRQDGQTFILSNNHVLANSNDAELGDAILQPGVADGGSFPEDHIASLHAFAPIEFGGQPSSCGTAGAVASVLNALAALVGSNTRLRAVQAQAAENLVDAAIARPLDDAVVSDQILRIGSIQGTATGDLGMALKKSGRTTELTTGQITQVDVSSTVQYGGGRTALFTNQLMAGAMSQGGDSGSAILDERDRLVGLLFAGSDNTTLFNPIDAVFAALRVTL